jgi:hypothetical protein
MPALLANVIDPQTQQPRTRAFWVVFIGLALAQLVAFWLVCSHQVRKAEARSTEVMVQQMALSDCLQYIPGSTIASCSSQMDITRAASHPAQVQTGAMPVSFTSFR